MNIPRPLIWAMTSRPITRPTGLALGDEQALGTYADRTVEVAQQAGGQAHTTGRDGRLRLQANPLADGLAVQVHSEFGVDEVPLGQVQLAADAVAAVGDRKHALQWAGRLAGDDRVPEPGPRGRRAGLPECPCGEAPFDRGQVA